jgi:hypothetical protein
LRAAPAGVLLVLGGLALMSIGLGLVIAGAMAAAAAVRSPLGKRRMLLSAGVAVVIAVGILIAGFEVTDRMIVCPDHGSMGGGGSGFVTGPYQFECVEGKLTFHSG